jgi:hypothetical protein
MTEHQLVLEHIANNHTATLEVMKVLCVTFPALRGSIDSIAAEHLRINKEIQDDYLAAYHARTT